MNPLKPLKIGSKSINCVATLSNFSVSPIFSGDNSGTFMAIQEKGKFFIASTSGKHARFEDNIIFDTNIRNGGKRFKTKPGSNLI
jgi:hypothetical protein